jgi:hypothetical protein
MRRARRPEPGAWRQPPRRQRSYQTARPDRPGEARLRAALRRWGRGWGIGVRGQGPERGSGAGDEVTPVFPGSRSPTPDPHGWWPRLTAPQVQALLGAGITLALVLWDQIRQRLLK